MIRRACAGVLFVLLCAEVVGHGPLSLRAPETVLSNTTPPQKESEAFLRFLRWVATRVPPGTTVAVLTPEQPGAGLMYFIAIGQLPMQEVWPAVGAYGNDVAGPDFVAAYNQLFEDPRYREVGSFPGGALFKAR